MELKSYLFRKSNREKQEQQKPSGSEEDKNVDAWRRIIKLKDLKKAAYKKDG